jgi:hypothetical protein
MELDAKLYADVTRSCPNGAHREHTHLQSKMFDCFVSPEPQTVSGGGRRDRTDDLMLAKHALSQLSYAPFQRRMLNAEEQRFADAMLSHEMST